MFTGLIEEVGTIDSVAEEGGARRIALACEVVHQGTRIDESLSVDGVCLTVVACEGNRLEVVAVEETLRKTTLGRRRRGDRVNLERALRPTGRLGGHFVQGHVDGVGTVAAWAPQQGGRLLTVEVPAELMRYIISEGSIAIDGVSLTVARLQGRHITISLIPQTLAKTTLGSKRIGDPVNIETDLLGKYVERLLSAKLEQKELTEERLREFGYGHQPI